MTEVERLLAQGVISEDFLRPETRYDYYIDSDTKKLWAINLDLLIQFEKVCKKYNLQWFLFYGSLLGVVRHKGFIPWDDDVDIYMPRGDYDKLIQIGSEAFSDPYFFQTPYSESDFYFSTIRLRNSRTSYIDYPFKYQNINHGIGLGIGPLDYYPAESASSRYKEIYSLIMDNAAHLRLKHPKLNERDLQRVKQYLERGGAEKDPLKTWEKINELSCGDESTGKLWIGVSQHYGMEKGIFEAEDFAEAVPGEFEGHTFPIPKGYKRILETIYGDYMQFPPIEKRGTWHGNAIYNPDVPYIEYLHGEGIDF